MRHRGRMADRIPMEFDINILVEQAEHEMKRGDPYVMPYKCGHVSRVHFQKVSENFRKSWKV